MGTAGWVAPHWPSTSLGRLAARQAGVVTRQQLRALGYSNGRQRAQIRAGRWRGIGRRVVVLTTGVLTREQRWWVAVLHVGGSAALAGATAAESWGLRGYELAEIHVVVQGKSEAIGLPGVVVHDSDRFLVDRDSVRVSPPRTRRARSLVDAAAWSNDPRRAAALLAAGVQQRLARPEELAAELEFAGRVRHAGVLRLALGDIVGGAHSIAEIDFVRLCRRTGLPLPQGQLIRRDASGRRRYLDVAWRLPDGRRVRAEIDGGVHLGAGSYWADMRRDNDLAEPGEVVLRFPAIAVRLDEAVVVGQLRRVLTCAAAPPCPSASRRSNSSGPKSHRGWDAVTR